MDSEATVRTTPDPGNAQANQRRAAAQHQRRRLGHGGGTNLDGDRVERFLVAALSRLAE